MTIPTIVGMMVAALLCLLLFSCALTDSQGPSSCDRQLTVCKADVLSWKTKCELVKP